MENQKVQLTLDPYEQRLMVGCLNNERTRILNDDGPTEDVEDLILKVIDAPAKKKGLFRNAER